MSLQCLFCNEEIEDGQMVVDGQHGEAIGRDKEEGFVGEVEFNSRFSTVHETCFQDLHGELEE